jgi:hypothetical protein
MRLQLRPCGIVVVVKLTLPGDAPRAEIVIVDTGEVPAIAATGEVADIVKSVTVNAAFVDGESDPLVPVISNV